MANLCKFDKKQYQVSYDSGVTWVNVTPEQISKGDNMIEYDSQDCSSVDTMYRWRTLDGQYLCDDKEKWTKEIQEESYNNGLTWYASYPTVYKKGTYVGIDETFCNDKFVGHYVVTGDTSSICPSQYVWNGYKCVYVDPLKIVKCNDSGVLTSEEIIYYSRNYLLISCEIGNCVTTIGESAFQSCTSLRSIEIPSGITSIGTAAFEYCTSLSSITIPDSVANIDSYTFGHCFSLSSVTIGSGVRSISKYAFTNCLTLSSITIPNSVETIDNYAFYYCSASISVSIGSGVTTIGEGAFQNCSSLTSVTIGDNVISIGHEAFYDCSSLASVYIPSSTRYIYLNAFNGCSSLSSITVDNIVPPQLQDGVFNDTNNCPIYVPAVSVDIYKNTNKWNGYADRIMAIPSCANPITSYKYNYKEYICDDNKKYEAYRKIWSCDNTTWYNVQPLQYMKGQEVENSDEQCPPRYIIKNNSSWTSSVDYGSLSSETENYDFYQNQLQSKNNKTKITIEVRGYDVFTFKIRNSDYYPNYNFIIVANLDDESWSSYSNREVYQGIGTYEGRMIYTNNMGTTDWVDVSFNLGHQAHTITIWNTTNSDYYLGNKSFVAFPKNVSFSGMKFKANYSDGTSLSAHCDASSVLQTSITKPSGYVASAMTSAEIGSCVTSIGEEAFYNCRSLSSVTIPNSVVSIGKSTFKYCGSLSSVTIPNSVTSIGNMAFDSCSGLIGVNIPNSITSIGYEAFYYCTSLTSIIIPSSVTEISGFAFADCTSLTSVTIGDSVTSIGDGAFAYCENLKSITCLPTTPPEIVNHWFNITGTFDYTNNCPIYVPCESVDTYRSAWSSYTSRIYGIPPCGEAPLWKFRATYSGGQTYDVLCGSDTTLTSATTKPNGYEISAMTSAEIGDCVTSIGKNAFNGCSSLTAITIPSGVTDIGVIAFQGCTSLTSIVIPSGVTSIGQNAFNGCSSLTSVTVNATTPPLLRGYTFNNTNNCPIYVPAASVDAYKAATNWSTYASRIQPIT